jgi:hypothetical protein
MRPTFLAIFAHEMALAVVLSVCVATLNSEFIPPASSSASMAAIS